ncbi:GT-D fold domain-containing protein [Leeuwenhoekiella parthenopeia]|uniref:GT-D fold-like domain-containing protein n=1 Tax=Leeuwenhoekiella parthenopeia TaxID=2890320 RepID=A0ABS8GYI0_9FLAO|nr:hypothetical protein [Leeuwenhoekiella parthenopeia]MCC4214252.1 hypothetical protein [Leeuwenhoekiella parthenopeia]
MKLPFLVNMDNIAYGSADEAYGGYLNAYSFQDITLEEWIEQFRTRVLNAMGKEYLPIYRMADGEYRFLLGRKYNLKKKNRLVRDILAVTAEKLRLTNPNKWKTSWGEQYSKEEVKLLRIELVEHIKYISHKGMLACYLNENGLNAFTEHNSSLIEFFEKNQIEFHCENYIPFHFVVGILVRNGWQDFIVGRKILVVTGTDAKKELNISKTLEKLGALKVDFYNISKTSSLTEKLNLKNYNTKYDICLVAAGIGSANILRQLRPLETVALDIGGYMNCLEDPRQRQHGGIFKLPIL